jgi:hypothetical protein
MYDPDDKADETPQDKQAQQRKWLKNLAQAERYFKTWFTRGDKIIKLYRKQGATDGDGATIESKRAFAMLWANTEVMKPVVYALTPEPAIARRFKDKDPAGKTASEILERACTFQFDQYDLDGAIKAARDDMLLPGRGVVWLRFVSDGVLACDYIHWRDFLHQPARRWSQVNWLAKRSWFAKDELKKRFNVAGDKLSKMSPDSIPKNSTMTEDERRALEGKYAIWEIWDKVTQKVYFITPSSEEPLEISEPFLQLTGFWPCPQPIYATMTTDSMIPVPDYKYYQDQAEEIDDLTRRISSLTDSLKVVGFYPRGQEDSAAIESALAPGTENKMIGVESWAAFAEKGGGKAIIFLPIDMVVSVIQACVELRQQLIQDVYQITGISDIMRGATDPNETLGAQQLKAQTGSVRVRNRQQDIQRFARDITRIACEIMADKFSPGVLMEMTNQNTQENQTPEKIAELEQAFKLMKNDQLRSFRIDVETDSTIQPDEQADKEARVEFVTAIGGFIQQAAPVGQALPALLPLMGETLRFLARGFKAGSPMEDVIDKTVDQMQQQAEQAAQAPPPPDPVQQQMQADQAIEQGKTQAQLQGKAQIDEADARARDAKAAQELQHNQAKHEQELALTAQKHQQALRERRNESILSLKSKANGTGGQLPPEIPDDPAATLPDPVAEISQAFQAAMQQIAQIMAQNNQQIAQLMTETSQQLAQLITAPKSITTPDGRTYTAQPQIVEPGQVQG